MTQKHVGSERLAEAAEPSGGKVCEPAWQKPRFVPPVEQVALAALVVDIADRSTLPWCSIPTCY